MRSARGKRVSRLIRRLVSIGIPLLLVVQLTRVGWSEIYRSLPSHPGFYLILLILFAALPVSETLIYRHAFGLRLLTGLPVFFKKRVYNNDVLNYSGEVYLYLWAERMLSRPNRQIIGPIKDNNIISAIASTSFAVCLVGILIMTDSILFPDAIANASLIQGLSVLAVIAILLAVVVKFRHAIFHVPVKSLVLFFGVHATRMIVVSVLQVIQWSLVLPKTSLSILLTLLTVQIVANRIPVLPVKDLVFLSVSVQLTVMLDLSSAAVAGMLLTSIVLSRLMNLAILFVVGVHEFRTTRTTMGLASLSAEEELDTSPVDSELGTG